MQFKALVSALALVATSAVMAGSAHAGEQIRIVGSSTVYPFTTAVAEQFGKTGGGKTPVVESTGTGGGMKIFCEGVGADKADATNASRRMKKAEFEACAKNGVTDIVELKVGFDGLTLSQS
ncbi:MAG: substrate-binding domain-containing protein, partial [Hyphomicrobiaceae bacterium]|nr:substrate-binding domain-containing protein [Hyphomicrobiaceae bacterium]